MEPLHKFSTAHKHDWEAVAREKMRRFPFCLLCDHDATRVYAMDRHSTVLRGDYPALLVTLCGDCFKRVMDSGCKPSQRNEWLTEEAKAEDKMTWVYAQLNERSRLLAKLGRREKYEKHKQVHRTIKCIACQKNTPKHKQTLCGPCKKDRGLD